MSRAVCSALLRLLPCAPVSLAAATVASAPVPVTYSWVHFDVPLWDIADEGLPFRFTFSRASSRDPVSRALHAREARWTLSAGYAKAYSSYDPTTRVFKNPGGHAALVSAGRQFRWHPPPFAGAGTPQIAVEFGLHAASRRFPADGTRVNLKLIAGLEWRFARNSAREWSLGVMWPHFSNANLFDRNAGYDGLALRIGRRMR